MRSPIVALLLFLGSVQSVVPLSQHPDLLRRSPITMTIFLTAVRLARIGLLRRRRTIWCRSRSECGTSEMRRRCAACKWNTEAIYKTRAGIVAVTGAYMTFNSGCLFRISKTAEGEWSASKWRVLPGVPRVSRLRKDGNLFISCHSGMVLISPEGRMRSVTRQEAGFKPIRQSEPAEVILEDIP